MIRFELGVRVSYFSPDLALILTHASIWSLKTGIGVVVNSMEDGTHGADSLHPYALAVDLDTEADQPRDLKSLHAWLRKWIPEGYDVVFEGDHVHVERDTHR